jgi:stalled ribosome alternative rescue factor ArfA
MSRSGRQGGRAKRGKKAVPRRNPAAKAVRSQQFRPRKVQARKGTKAYQRRTKHPKEAPAEDPDGGLQACAIRRQPFDRKEFTGKTTLGWTGLAAVAIIPPYETSGRRGAHAAGPATHS